MCRLHNPSMQLTKGLGNHRLHTVTLQEGFLDIPLVEVLDSNNKRGVKATKGRGG
jgi:hypothetical protein